MTFMRGIDVRTDGRVQDGDLAHEIGAAVPLAGELEHTGARVQELSPEISSEQNLSGEHLSPSLMAGIAGALLG